MKNQRQINGHRETIGHYLKGIRKPKGIQIGNHWETEGKHSETLLKTIGQPMEDQRNPIGKPWTTIGKP